MKNHRLTDEKEGCHGCKSKKQRRIGRVEAETGVRTRDLVGIL